TAGKLIGTEISGIFLKAPMVPTTVGFLPKAGITLSNFTFNDLGTYRVTVNFKRSGSFFSQSRSAVLALPDAPIISGDRLVAHVQAEPVTDVITGDRHIGLTCGTFLELGSRPVSVDWRLQKELLLLEDGVQGLQDKDQAVDDELERLEEKDANLTSRDDQLQKELLLLEDGVQGLQDKDQAVDDELERLEEKDTNLTSRDDQLQKELLLLEDGVQGLQDKDQAVDDELERLEEKDANLTSRDDQLQKELLQLGEADDKIQSEVDDLRADVNSNVYDLQHKVSLREKADDTLASDLTDLQGNVSALEKRNTLEDKLASDVATLQEEQDRCKSLGGKLAEIESSEENTFVKGLAQQAGRSTWLGGSDMKSEGTWKWESSGNNIQFTDWESRQPDNYGKAGQDCLLLWSSRSYRWDDEWCNRSTYFVCELR
ncbi:hypothetical protein BaRGS_00016040, partial [Batillaria attramentaria]